MERHRISVAICTCNGVRYLVEQLASISAQTQLPDEVVFCDDKSEDATSELLRDFAAQAPFPVRIFFNDVRLGSTKNFERAIGLCSGDVIVLGDQDDIWKPNKVERLCSVFRSQEEVQYAFSNGNIIDHRSQLTGDSIWGLLGFSDAAMLRHYRENALRFLLKHNVVTGAAMAFRSSLRPLLLPIPAGWVHDHWIALLGSIYGTGLPVPDQLILYRRHQSQQVGVGQRSIVKRYKTSMETGEADNERKRDVFRQLELRIAENPAFNHSEDKLKLIRDKSEHLAVRAAARAANGLEKTRLVLSETAAGRYHRYSKSWHSVARDLLSPSK
jgi:glycosyltransferase involved in cell wall biosynthesis